MSDGSERNRCAKFRKISGMPKVRPAVVDLLMRRLPPEGSEDAWHYRYKVVDAGLRLQEICKQSGLNVCQALMRLSDTFNGYIDWSKVYPNEPYLYRGEKRPSIDDPYQHTAGNDGEQIL